MKMPIIYGRNLGNNTNRLQSHHHGSTQSTYWYNPTEQRVVKAVNGSKTWFSYHIDGKLLYERTGSVHKSYIYLGGELIGFTKNNQLHYVHSDHTGRPEIATTTSNSKRWQAENTAFDRAVKQDNLGGLNLGYPGQYWDSEKQSWYNHHRDYDAKLGRYLQSDPLGLEAGVNTYGYVDGNPIKYVDPDGKIKILVTGAKIAYKGSKKGGNFKKAGKDAWFDAVDDVSEIFDGDISWNDLGAVSDLILGTEFNDGSVGSYTNLHKSGKRYHGKGTKKRMNDSAKEKEKKHDDPVAQQHYKPAKNDKEAFKDEAKRIEADGGVKNPNNYNKINSPGKKILQNESN